MILGLVGIWHLAAGLVALSDPSWFQTTRSGIPLQVGYTTWGWTHVVIGALALASSLGVVAGNRLASAVAVVLAVVSAVVNLVFMTAQPVAAVIAIALDVLVVWGVTSRAAPLEPAGRSAP